MNQTKILMDEVNKVIIGKEQVVEEVMMAILAKGHVLLEDVPGVGKTTLALAFSKALGMNYRRIQFTPDVMPSDVVGFNMYEKSTGAFTYKPGAVMCNLLLADEINRTSSKTQAALLEVMEEGNVTVDGKTYEVPKPFIVIATQNPFGSAGTQLLPQSQLDRFMIKIQIGYPDSRSQIDILRNRQVTDPLDFVSQVVSEEKVKEMQEEAMRITMSEPLLSYITDLVEATRNHKWMHLGVSPRGALALNNLAKAAAYVNQRDYVTPEDIIKVFPSVCGHRVILNPKARVSDVDVDQVMKEIVEQVQIPTAAK